MSKSILFLREEATMKIINNITKTINCLLYFTEDMDFAYQNDWAISILNYPECHIAEI